MIELCYEARILYVTLLKVKYPFVPKAGSVKMQVRKAITNVSHNAAVHIPMTCP